MGLEPTTSTLRVRRATRRSLQQYFVNDAHVMYIFVMNIMFFVCVCVNYWIYPGIHTLFSFSHSTIYTFTMSTDRFIRVCVLTVYINKRRFTCSACTAWCFVNVVYTHSYWYKWINVNVYPTQTNNTILNKRYVNSTDKHVWYTCSVCFNMSTPNQNYKSVYQILSTAQTIKHMTPDSVYSYVDWKVRR